MADRLAKKTEMDGKAEIVNDKIPRENIITDEAENGLRRWQEQWTSSTKGAVHYITLHYITLHYITVGELFFLRETSLSCA
jgi:hypothetical protein